MTTFEELYEKTFDKKLSWIKFNFPKLRNPEDVLQDSYLYFYQHYYNKWDSSICALDTYFTGYLNLSLLSNTKKDSNYNKIFTSIDNGLDDTTYHNILTNPPEVENENLHLFKLNKVKLIMDNAPQKYKDYYELLIKFNNGVKYKELAEQTGLNLSTIKNRIGRIRIYINEEYSKKEGIKVEFKKSRSTANKDKTYYFKNKDKIAEKYKVKNVNKTILGA